MVLPLKKRGFGFGEVANILMELFTIDENKRDTFIGRLQQLQKAGIPGGSNSRRGAKIRYVNWQLADLMFALDLLDVGLTPATLANNPLASAYAMGGYGYHVQTSLDEGRADLFWMISAKALAYLASSSEEQDKSNPLDALAKGRSADNVIDALSEGPSIVINMTRRLRALREAIEGVYPDMLDEITFYPTRSGQKED
jgi:hypothetical protein